MVEKKPKETIAVTYRPGQGDPQTTDAYGYVFKAGETVEIPAEFADKARGNPYFAVKGEETFGDDRDEQHAEEPQPEATFEDNVAAAHREEYGTDDPEEVDSLRRAREHNQELRSARRSPDRDEPPAEKPTRGRRGRRSAAADDSDDE